MPEGRERKSLVIIGLGNESLSDDGVGIRAVRELKRQFAGNDVSFEELSIGGLSLLEFLPRGEHCVIIDAVMTGRQPPGTVYRFVQGTEKEPRSVTSSHQIDLAQVISLGAMLGAPLPLTVTVYGIEAADITTFCEECTPEVARAVPIVADRVRSDWEDPTKTLPPRGGGWEIVDAPAAA